MPNAPWPGCSAWPRRAAEMWQSYLNGLLVAAGLIIAIGAQNAFVLAQSLRREHHLPVAALCVLCDALLVAGQQRQQGDQQRRAAAGDGIDLRQVAVLVGA